jgi:uncharacterized protein
LKATYEIQVSRPAQEVWDFFQDIPAVADCLPGAELTEDKGDGVYGGKVSVKLGPMSAVFEGEATVTPDPTARLATIDGKGVDRRGGSRGQVKVTYRVEPAEAGCKVLIDSDVTLAGAAAQFGRTGLINEMSNRLIGDFVNCLEAKLSATSPKEASEITAGEVRGFSLFFSSLWARLRRLFGRR